MKKASSATTNHLWLRKWQSSAQFYLTLSLVLSTVGGLVLILQAGLLAYILNAVVLENATVPALTIVLSALVGLIPLRLVVIWWANQSAANAALHIKHQLREQLYTAVHHLGLRWTKHESHGAIINTLTDKVEALDGYYARYLPTMNSLVWILLAILITVVIQDWLSALVMIITAPLIPLFMILIGQGTERRNQQQWQSLTRLSAYLLEVLQNLTTLKLFNTSKTEAQQLARLSEQYRKNTMQVLRIAFLSSLALEFLASVSIALIAVFIGFRLLWGEMDFFTGFFILLLAPEFYLPLRSLGTHYHARLEALGVINDITRILDQAESTAHSDSLAALSTPIKVIHLNQVGLTYQDERISLKPLTATLPLNQTIAIVGASGAGKSSLLQLMLGLEFPTQGEILLDDQRLSSEICAQWWQQIAWIPQRPHLIAGTVAENIALGQSNPDQKAIIEAAQKAYAHEFISTLPQGYDTLIGEGGVGLSGGQIQRIALARAFFKKAPIWIVDEPTAHLDRETEDLIQAVLLSLGTEHTLIMVTHRLAILTQMDWIWVLDQGELVAEGNHTTLQAQSRHYQTLLNYQVEFEE